MSIFDQFSKVTKDFGNKAQEMTKDIKGKLEEQQAISRLNAQVNEAKNQMKNTYMAIGERYYELHKDDVENDMANQFQIIADAMEKIAKCEQQIRDIKNENTCPSCGATISKDVLFCPNCGTKIERPKPSQNRSRHRRFVLSVVLQLMRRMYFVLIAVLVLTVRSHQKKMMSKLNLSRQIHSSNIRYVGK